MGWFQDKSKSVIDTGKEFLSDPRRVARAQFSAGVSEAPTVTGKNWEQLGVGPNVGPPGGATPLISDITNPYSAAAAQAAGQLGGMLPQYGQFYGTGAGAVTGLIGDLQAQARGQAGPGMSLGQALLQQGLTQNIGAVQSQLASQRGLSPAMRARLAARQTAQLQGQSAQQAGILGLQQQLAAQEQLGKLGMGAASLGSESQLKGTGILTGAQTDIEKVRANIAAANLAAQAADKARTVQAVTSALGAGGQVLASGATGGAALTGEQTAGPDTYGRGGSNQYSAYAAYGGRIDGVAPYAGDTPKNDVVSAQLSPGEIVIPRTAAGSKKDAKAFIDALDDWDEEPSYGKVLKARQKKNYADGGMIPYSPEWSDVLAQDEKMAQESAQKYLERERAPFPAVEKAKASFDEFLGNRVVEPLAQRGYPTLGAALATIPSTAMEALVPSTPDELMAAVVPMPGLKKGSRTAAKAEKDEIIDKFLTGMKSMEDDVDISRLKPELYKKYAKDIDLKKRADVLEELKKQSIVEKDEKFAAMRSALGELVGGEFKGSIPRLSLDLIAAENKNIPEVKKALNDVQVLLHGEGNRSSGRKNVMAVTALDDAYVRLSEALASNKGNLKLPKEFEELALANKVTQFPGDRFTGSLSPREVFEAEKQRLMESRKRPTESKRFFEELQKYETAKEPKKKNKLKLIKDEE